MKFVNQHKKRKPSKKIIFIAAAILLLALAWWVSKTSGNDKRDENTRTVKVQKGSIEEVVTAQGKLEPKEYVDVGTQVSGQIKSLHVDIGDDVKKGMLLAEIDPRLYESRLEADTAQLRSLQAGLSEQEANLALAQQQHARNETLIKTDAISKDAFDVSAANLKSAQARVNTQKAQIAQITSTIEGDKTNLEYTKIYAPMDGTVVTLPARLGQTLNANQTAPTLMQIANLDVMTIRAQVAEADVMRLSEGMNVHFTTLGAQEKRWKATVRQVLPSPEVINDVVLYNVLIDVDNRERILMNGMSTQVFFELGSAQDVLVLPIEALGRRIAKDDNDTGKAYNVHIGDKDVPVYIGLMDRTNAEIKSGLKEGDSVTVVRPPANTQRQNRGGGGPVGMGGPRL